MRSVLDPGWLTLIGTTGWLLMLLTKAVIKNSISLVVLIMLFAIGIIDVWAVVPLHLGEDASLRLVLFYWGLAVGPWIVCVFDVVRWITKKLEQEHPSTASKHPHDMG